MASRYFSAETREKWAYVRNLLLVLPLVAGLCLVLAPASSALAAEQGRAAPSEADEDGSPRGRDFDGPSEDGTDDEAPPARPGTAEPEQSPGCKFRNAPLELLV